MTITGPVIEKITKRSGIAGHFELVATVRYEGEEPETVTFVGSVYGGPVVMVTPAGAQHFVTEPGRYGEFGEAWVRRFFGEV